MGVCSQVDYSDYAVQSGHIGKHAGQLMASNLENPQQPFAEETLGAELRLVLVAAQFVVVTPAVVQTSCTQRLFLLAMG
jgi:hypothetical protein